MKFIHFSYAHIASFDDPHAWLDRIEFFTGLLERMTAQAEVVAVYNIRFKGTLERQGVTYLFPGFGKRQLRWPWRFNNYILSLKPDVVLIQGFSPWQILMLGRTHPGLKIMVQHRAEKPFKGIKKFLQRRADKYISWYFFSAADLADDWIKHRQIQSKKKVVEALGMSSTFKGIQKKISINTTSVGNLVFLWVGDLDANKNPVLAVDAFLEFLNRHPSAELLMIYQGTELERVLQERVLTSGGQIRLIGKVPHGDMIKWYNAADFILSTSFYESAGLSVCEGMSCGCVPVVTNIPSFRMMTDRGRVGMLFETNDRDSLIAALEKCALMDRASAREKVLAYFEEKLSFEANVHTIMEAANRHL
ncbi:MAG TPA: glycosyltransferase family 4 protein [Cyclobacteriaceae bacterium]|nr:glycosyltransferase family 4 protein [Cyclobacteriaceae bacterium]